MMWKIELVFDSNDDDAEVIHTAVHSFLIDFLEEQANDVPWAMIVSDASSDEAPGWRPLLHSSRRESP